MTASIDSTARAANATVDADIPALMETIGRDARAAARVLATTDGRPRTAPLKPRQRRCAHALKTSWPPTPGTWRPGAHVGSAPRCLTG